MNYTVSFTSTPRGLMSHKTIRANSEEEAARICKETVSTCLEVTRVQAFVGGY